MKEKDVTEGEKLYQIFVNGKWGFIDKTGKLVIEPTFDNVDDFSEGLAAVKIEEHRQNW